MLSSSLLRVFKYALLALLLAGPHCVLSAKPIVLPRETARHFCQLLVFDGSAVSTLSQHGHQMMQADDSLSVDQIFAGYVLLADNWQTVRIFPHQQDGQVSWYSATDVLPASMDSEHQKYIREVFPRLIEQVRAGDWQTVDAFIDKMLQYQSKFGSQQVSSPVSSTFLVVVALIFVAVILVSRFFYVLLSPKRKL